MQANDIIKYIRNPQSLDKASIIELQKLVSDFPYFQTGHILLSLAAKKWDASIYQQSIKRTAIVVSNRARLYDLIHQEEVVGKIENVVGNHDSYRAEELVLKLKEENSGESLVISDESEPIANNQQQETSDQKLETSNPIIDESSVETELEKSLVNSFVEKEVLKIDNQKISQPASFTEWLNFLQSNEGAAEELVKKELKSKSFEKVQQDQIKRSKQKQKDLIDKIIEKNPGPFRPKEDQKFFKSDQQAKESLLENEHLITETLAQLYASQGAIPKAIRSYEILSLKFPQKSVYFASLIQKLKDSQKK